MGFVTGGLVGEWVGRIVDHLWRVNLSLNRYGFGWPNYALQLFKILEKI